MREKDSLCKIFLTIILGGLGLVLFSHMPLLSNFRIIFIFILILNGTLIVLKIVYPPIFSRAIWGLLEWGAVLLIILSFLMGSLMVSYQFILGIDSISKYISIFLIHIVPILIFGTASAALAWKRTNKVRRYDFVNGILNYKRISKRSKKENAIIIFITVYSFLAFPYITFKQLGHIDNRFVVLGGVGCLIIPFLSSMAIDMAHQILRIFVWQLKNKKPMYIKGL